MTYVGGKKEGKPLLTHLGPFLLCGQTFAEGPDHTPSGVCSVSGLSPAGAH